MTEQELHDRLNELTDAVPAETHRMFLAVASPGKDKIVIKTKKPIVLIIAVIISLVTIAFAANGIIQTFSVNWEGKVPEDLTESLETTELDIIKKTHSLLSAVPEDRYGIVEWDGTPPRFSRGRTRKANTLDGIDHLGITLPEDIETKDSFVVDLAYGCAANGEYRLEQEETIDGFTVKQYSVDPAYDVLTGYTIGYKDDTNTWRYIRSQLSITQNSQFSFAYPDEDNSSAEPVDIPGIDKAVFVTSGQNHRLIATRTLDSPVIVKTEPGKYLPDSRNGTTEYPYELIELDGFTLKECMGILGI